MYDSPKDVALLIAVTLARSGKTRGRISERTLRNLGRRERLKGAFLDNVRAWLEEFDVLAVPLDRGGFALISASALESAPPLLARNFVANEIRALRRGELDRAALWRELGKEWPNDDELE